MRVKLTECASALLQGQSEGVGGAANIGSTLPKVHIYPSGHEDEECVGGAIKAPGVIAAVVSVVYNRPDYLKRHAASLLSVLGADPANMCAPLLLMQFPLGVFYVEHLGAKESAHTGILPCVRAPSGATCRVLRHRLVVPVTGGNDKFCLLLKSDPFTLLSPTTATIGRRQRTLHRCKLRR